MALGETQTLLARLFTDAALRRAFFDAPEAVARRFGLDDAEARRFAAIDVRELESFAQSLMGKRILDLRKAMPLTAAALDKLFGEILAEGMSWRPGRRHRDDAAVLVQRLGELGRAGDISPWLVDIARYEQAFIAATGPCLLARRFDHDIASIATALRAGTPVKAATRKSLGLWARAKGGKLRFRLFVWPSFTPVGKPR